MRVEVLANQALEGLGNDQYSFIHDAVAHSWIYGYMEPQALVVNVSATDVREVGHGVGLSQMVVSSMRHATYEGGGRLTMTVDRLPCLDAHGHTSPWYGSQSYATLEALEVPVQLSVHDRPFGLLPLSAWGPDKEEHPINSSGAADRFVVSLLDENQTTDDGILKQWAWGYYYKLEQNDEMSGRGKLASHGEQSMQELSSRVPIVTRTPMAADVAITSWRPGWTPVR